MTHQTTFTLVPRKKKRMPRRWLLPLVALVLIASAAAAAGVITVGVREEAAAIFAERVEIGDRFELVDQTISVASADATAIGTLAAPVEASATLPQARTGLTRDHWTYSVTVRERSANAIAAGTYSITAFADGTLLGVVHVKQEAADAGAVEGVRVTYNVGAQLASSSLYYVVVDTIVDSIPTTSVTLRSNPNDNLTWLGDGDAVNPTISLAPGTILHLTGKNADGQTHNIGITTAAGALISPPGWSPNFGVDGETQTISWTGASGTYRYKCQYHPTTMAGDIVVG